MAPLCPPKHFSFTLKWGRIWIKGKELNLKLAGERKKARFGLDCSCGAARCDYLHHSLKFSRFFCSGKQVGCSQACHFQTQDQSKTRSSQDWVMRGQVNSDFQMKVISSQDQGQKPSNLLLRLLGLIAPSLHQRFWCFLETQTFWMQHKQTLGRDQDHIWRYQYQNPRQVHIQTDTS